MPSWKRAGVGDVSRWRRWCGPTRSCSLASRPRCVPTTSVFPLRVIAAAGVQRSTNRYSRCRDVRARIADIGELRSGAGKAAAPPTRCGPKLRDALGICEHPLALKEPPQQWVRRRPGRGADGFRYRTSGSAWAPRRWRYSFGPPVWSAVEVQSTVEAKLSLRRSRLATPHCLAPGELLVEVPAW